MFVATKNKSALGVLSNDGVNLLIHFDTISSIGEEHNLKRLDECVYTPTEQISEFLQNTGASEKEIEQANPELWFTPEYGLDLMQRYIEIITNYHSLSDTTKSKIIIELKEFYSILKVLCAESNDWHFEYDF